MAGIFGIDLFDPTQQQTAQLQPFAAGVSPPGSTGGMFGQPAAAGGMTPWLRLALQTVAGGLAGSSGRNFGQGVQIGAQYGQQVQETARRNRYVDEQTKYMQGRATAEQQQAQLKQQQLESLYKMPAPAGVDPQQWANMVRINPDYALEIAYPKPQQPTSEVRNFEYGLKHPDFAARQENLRKAGATQVSVGGQTVTNNPLPLDKSNTTKQQESALDTQGQLDGLNYIEKLYSPDYLTYRGGIEAWGADQLNKLDPNQRSQFAGRRAAFASQTNQFFNAYRKWATGAAASERELSWLQESVPSMEDSPQEFEAKLKTMKQRVKLVNIRSQMALRAGIQPGADPNWRKFAAEHPLEGIPDANARGKELMDLGYTKEQALGILRQEGY